MATYDKNIHYLKEAIFAKLNDDATLRALLKGTNRIFNAYPQKDASYPCVVYAIISDVDNVFNETISTGEVTETYFRVTIFSKESTTTETDNIEARIKALLHGQRNLDTGKIICYSCFRNNLMEPRKDPKVPIWVTMVRYKVVWATK